MSRENSVAPPPHPDRLRMHLAHHHDELNALAMTDDEARTHHGDLHRDHPRLYHRADSDAFRPDQVARRIRLCPTAERDRLTALMTDHHDRIAAARRATRPSFAALVAQQNADHAADPTHPRWGPVRDKQARRAWLAERGFPHAPIRHVLVAADLHASHLAGQDVVLKPADGAAGIGVMVLVARDRSWHEIRTGATMTMDSIRARMGRVAEQYPRWRDLWIVEERMLPLRHPDVAAVIEYQCLTFGGRVEAVKAHRPQRGRTTRRWWDARWRPANVGRVHDTIDTLMPRPAHPGQVIDLAVRVAAALPAYTFLRVDVADTAAGPMVGEINDTTGDTSFSPHWDTRLGVAWARALRDTHSEQSGTPIG